MDFIKNRIMLPYNGIFSRKDTRLIIYRPNDIGVFNTDSINLLNINPNRTAS